MGLIFRYQKVFNTHDAVKILATVAMIIDHVGEYLFNNNEICRLIGRSAAPLFFFLVGYSGKVRITFSLVFYGFILSLTGGLIHHAFWINILFNFILITTFLAYFPLQNIKTGWRVFFFIFAMVIHVFIAPYLEYGLLGLLIAYSARALPLQDKEAEIGLIFTLIVYCFWQHIVFQFTNPYYAPLLFLVLFLIMRHYRLVSIACPPWALLPALSIARYSLPIYFFHLLILQIYYFSTFVQWGRGF